MEPLCITLDDTQDIILPLHQSHGHSHAPAIPTQQQLQAQSLGQTLSQTKTGRGSSEVLQVCCKSVPALLYVGKYESGSKGKCILVSPPHTVTEEWMTPNEYEERSGSKSKKYLSSIKYLGQPLRTYVNSGELRGAGPPRTAKLPNNGVKEAGKIVPRKQRKSNKSTLTSASKISSRILNPPPPEARDNAMDMSNFVRNNAQREAESEYKNLRQEFSRIREEKGDNNENTKFFQGELKKKDTLMALEIKKREDEMKKMKGEMKNMVDEMKKREEEWKGKMKNKEEELQQKDNNILELRSELAKEKDEKNEAKKELEKEKKEKEEAKKELAKETEEKYEARKELDDIKQMNINIGDLLLSRKRGRPTVQESKGEYVEKEEDVKMKTETNQNAEDDDNNESLRYMQRFFRTEAGQN